MISLCLFPNRRSVIEQSEDVRKSRAMIFKVVIRVLLNIWHKNWKHFSLIRAIMLLNRGLLPQWLVCSDVTPGSWSTNLYSQLPIQTGSFCTWFAIGVEDVMSAFGEGRMSPVHCSLTRQSLLSQHKASKDLFYGGLMCASLLLYQEVLHAAGSLAGEILKEEVLRNSLHHPL